MGIELERKQRVLNSTEVAKAISFVCDESVELFEFDLTKSTDIVILFMLKWLGSGVRLGPKP